HAREARDLAWDRAASTTASREFAGFLDDVALAAQTSALQSQDGDRRPRRPLKSTGSRVLDKLLRKARRRGRHPAQLDDSERHRLRIALKTLRYAAEFYLPLYGKKRAKVYLSELRTLLDDLGSLSDIASLRSTLARLAGGEGMADSFASGLLIGWHGLRSDRLKKRAIRRWRRFRKLKPFWV
ncbi:MAG: CHAD domain-containing protein, partial [Alphaproteobacteria bacterium]|nr:CHAD domain-containing protein [Alphaproteobacteria bacterium]